MEIGREENAARRKGKANRAQGESNLLTKMICDSPSDRAADHAADQGAPRGPSDSCRIEMKQLAEVANGSADHNIVVAEKESAECGDAGRNEQRAARGDRRSGLKRGGRQIIGLGRWILARACPRELSRAWP